ncbi:hypothetical protein QA601_04020 [Chitinispirillales bacterium ANBcel5]|uniref:hypothetical protein n=1 Tax=Cellulosispirillum alkaliphilum TaxID=3039283 RepID=UPI002A560F36|nr:hypothetical protein [Chitinispirillales bacterium ANBcel5]
MLRKTSVLTVGLILLFSLSVSATRLWVMIDDGITYKPVPNCEITLFDNDDGIVFYAYTNYRGNVFLRGVGEGEYRGELRVFNRYYHFTIEIDHTQEADTVFIYK